MNLERRAPTPEESENRAAAAARGLMSAQNVRDVLRGVVENFRKGGVREENEQYVRARRNLEIAERDMGKASAEWAQAVADEALAELERRERGADKNSGDFPRAEVA